MHWYQEAGNYSGLGDNPIGSHKIHGYSAPDDGKSQNDLPNPVGR